MFRNLVLLFIFLMPVSSYAQNNKINIMVFGASWCPPCKKMDTEIWTNIRIKQAIRSNKIIVHHIDVNSKPQLAKNFNVKKLPTIIIGTTQQNKLRILYKQSGFHSVPALQKILSTMVHRVKQRQNF